MGSNSVESVGFIGLGAMGGPMVTNLVNHLPEGSQIYVHDVVEAAVTELCGRFPNRIFGCTSAKDVAEKSDVVLTMLPEGSHVKSVYMDGICTVDISRKLLIDCSTIDTATSIYLKDYISDSFPAASFYDAPVSGGVIGAVKGTIAFFLGCASDDPNLPRLTELLRKMGKNVIPCGGPSLGLAAKLSNNYLSGIITIACSEAMDMGMRAGIDAKVLASVFAAGTAQNAICDTFNPVPHVCPEAPSSRGYEGGFRVQLMRKDFSLAVNMAHHVGAQNMLGEKGLAIYTAASTAPHCKDLDSRVVFRYIGGNENWRETDKVNGVEK